MIRMIKSYNVYTSKIIVTLAHILFPLLILTIFPSVTFFMRNSDAGIIDSTLKVLSGCVVIYVLVVNILADRFSIGTILVNNSQTNELLKSSSKGEGMLLNVAVWDIFVRLFSAAAIFLGIFIARINYRQGRVSSLLAMMLLCIISTHCMSSLLSWICRKIESIALSSLIMGFGSLLMIPVTLISVFPVKEMPSWIILPTTAVYLVGDVIVNVVGMLLLKRFIKNEWYKDSSRKDNEDET